MKILFNFLVLFVFSQTWSQSTTNQPASYYGLGESSAQNHGIFDALGKNTINVFDSTILNFYNPATYNTLSTGNTLYSYGIQTRISNYSEQSKTQVGFTGMIDHIAIGVRIKKNMGLAFGLKPYSARGYLITDKSFTGFDSLEYTYKGSGAIQDLFLGYSYGLVYRPKTKLSIGGNASYLFGTVTNERQAKLIASGSNQGGININSLIIRSFHYELGAYFQQQLGKNHLISLSSVYLPNQTITGDYQDEFYTASNINSSSTYDTIAFSRSRIHLLNSSTLELGLNYSILLPRWKRETRELHPKLSLMASLYQFGALDHNAHDLIPDFGMTSFQRLSFGAQFSPESRLMENISTLKGLEKMTYRIGYYTQSLPYTTNAIQYQESAVSFGLGLPIMAQMSASSVNFSINLGSRTSNQSFGIQEKFASVNLSFILAPSNFDKWFRQRKLD
ncbi:MAG: hypothetical protein RLZZ585_797 [Bacteroidota bacterium]|jgi:hypothetical protein